MVGGAYLCFEGFEKVAHKYLHSPAEEDARRAERVRVVTDVTVDLVVFEKSKIKGAVRTDFVLSAEIIAITLGTVAAAPFLQQVAVLTGIAVIMTVGVYGFVAGIVKLDDLGLWLSRQDQLPWRPRIGRRHCAVRRPGSCGGCLWPVRWRCSWWGAVF
jgi:predicted DNA repair protein MutK